MGGPYLTEKKAGKDFRKSSSISKDLNVGRRRAGQG